MIRTLIAGFGYATRTFHLPLLNQADDFELCGFISTRPDEIYNSYPKLPVFADLADGLERLKPDLVVLCTPNHLHASQARISLLAGAHVVVEKPFALSSTEARELTALARKRRRKLTVFHNRRWDGDFLTVRKLIETGNVGDVKIFESRFDRFRPKVRSRWRELPGPGAGIFWDLGPHLIDQALQLFGPPQEILAQLHCLRDGCETTDAFCLSLSYPGRLVQLSSSPFQAAVNERFNIQGSKGSYRKFGFDPQEQQLKSNMLPGHEARGREPENDYGIFYTESGSERVPTETGRYEQFYRQLAGSILHGEEIPVTPESAAAVIGIIEIAHRSWREQRSLVCQVST